MGRSRIALALALGLLAWLSGCEVVRDVGDNRIRPVPRDAATSSFDASVEAGPEPFNPPPRYPEAASPDAFAEFKERIGGTWYGIVSLPDQSEVIQVQLDLDPSTGTYKISCRKSAPCDPFGLASSREEGGQYGLDYLDRSGTAYGWFAWDGPFFQQRITFSDMLLQRQNQVLSFGFQASIGRPGERTAVLVRTPPDMEMDAQVAEDGGMP